MADMYNDFIMKAKAFAQKAKEAGVKQWTIDRFITDRWEEYMQSQNYGLQEEQLGLSREGKTQVIEVDGRKKLIDTITGEVIQDLGMAELADANIGLEALDTGIGTGIGSLDVGTPGSTTPAIDDFGDIEAATQGFTPTKDKYEGLSESAKTAMETADKKTAEAQGMNTDYADISDFGISDEAFAEALRRVQQKTGSGLTQPGQTSAINLYGL